MIMRKSLLLFGFLFLLSGCIKNPCVGPGLEISEILVPECTYKIQITQIDMAKYLVTGTIPEDEKSPQKTPDTYTFRVVDLDKLANSTIKEKETHWFLRRGNSPYLEHFPGEPQRRTNYPKD